MRIDAVFIVAIAPLSSSPGLSEVTRSCLRRGGCSARRPRPDPDKHPAGFHPLSNRRDRRARRHGFGIR